MKERNSKTKFIKTCYKTGRQKDQIKSPSRWMQEGHLSLVSVGSVLSPT
jgi:hypothetical protein